jgi:hypothetical protein
MAPQVERSVVVFTGNAIDKTVVQPVFNGLLDVAGIGMRRKHGPPPMNP